MLPSDKLSISTGRTEYRLCERHNPKLRRCSSFQEYRRTPAREDTHLEKRGPSIQRFGDAYPNLLDFRIEQRQRLGAFIGTNHVCFRNTSSSGSSLWMSFLVLSSDCLIYQEHDRVVESKKVFSMSWNLSKISTSRASRHARRSGCRSNVDHFVQALNTLRNGFRPESRSGHGWVFVVSPSLSNHRVCANNGNRRGDRK
jgi:hypothetical protein